MKALEVSWTDAVSMSMSMSMYLGNYLSFFSTFTAENKYKSDLTKAEHLKI